MPTPELGDAVNAALAPEVIAVGKLPTFINNQASAAADSTTDNANWYGGIKVTPRSGETE
ncbi:MAG: hypothetical protein HC922_06075 [Leptolyngbyaceae cyanobacterium SM2_3_12]|nr:hypothetical protein [Leptolyngbyaceae cyanobacterium SM2_3_12]